MFYKSFFSPPAAAALLLGVGLIAASLSASADTQVISDVNLDGNATRAILIRSDSTPPQLKAGRLVNNQMQFTTLADPGANFRIVAATDLNKNNRADLVFQDITQGEFGDVSVWPDFNASAQFLLRKVKRVWDVQAVGDLDGDGFGDLVWRYTVVASPDTGVSYIWFTNGTSVTQVRKRGGAPVSWTLLGAADLNGDGAVDMVYVDPSNNIRVLMATPNRTCANLTGQAIPPGYKILKFGKFANFFGVNTYGVLSRNPTTGATAISYLDATGLTLPTYTGAPDDPNASCTPSSLIIRNTATDLPMTDPTWQFYAVGDFNGDGITDIAWVRPDGTLAVWLVQAGAFNAPIVIANAGAAPFYTPPLPVSAPTITSTTPPNSGTIGAAYSHTYAATGGSATTTWSVTVGALPAGITLNSATGVLSGTPTTAGVFAFTVQASNGTLPNAIQAAVITVSAALPPGPPVSGQCLNSFDFGTGNLYVSRTTGVGLATSEMQQKIIGPGTYLGKAVTIVEGRNLINGVPDAANYVYTYYEDKGATIGVIAVDQFSPTGTTTTTYNPVNYIAKIISSGDIYGGNYIATTTGVASGFNFSAKTYYNYNAHTTGTEDVTVPAGTFTGTCKVFLDIVTTRTTFELVGFPGLGATDVTCVLTGDGVSSNASAIGNVRTFGKVQLCTSAIPGGALPPQIPTTTELIRATVNGKSYP